MICEETCKSKTESSFSLEQKNIPIHKLKKDRNVLAYHPNKEVSVFFESKGFDVFTLHCCDFMNSFFYEKNKTTYRPSKVEIKFSFFAFYDMHLLSTLAQKLLMYEASSKCADSALVYCQGDFPDPKGVLELKNFIFETFGAVSSPASAVDNEDGSQVSFLFVFPSRDSISAKDIMPLADEISEFLGAGINIEAFKTTKTFDEKITEELVDPPTKKAVKAKKKRKTKAYEKVVDILLSDPEATPLSELTSFFSRTSVKSVSGRDEWRKSVCVTGVSLGLPNFEKQRRFFEEKNLDRMFAGESLLVNLSEKELECVLRQRIVQVRKNEEARVKVPVDRKEDLFQIVSKLGDFDLNKEYGVPSYMIEGIDKTSQLAIAAGLEALRNAKITLKKSEKHPFELPEQMKNDTGIIFASSFPQIESCVEAVTNYMAHRFRVCSRSELKELVKMKPGGGKEASEQYCDESSREEDEDYAFDRKLLFKLLVLANSQLAELIGAKGPNTFVNAACASTAQAISIASDWIETRRCRRVLVVAADNATSDKLLPYIGSGFLSLGASCTKRDVSEAAVPFDKRRSGMILGMGAVGLLLEAGSACFDRRGVPLTQLVHSQVSNSAFHATLLDKIHIAEQLERFVSSVERKTRISRSSLAKNLIYFSHETGTSKMGGCARAEVDALRAVFGSSCSQILVTALKGFVGHPMGANIEDAVAVASLSRGKVPPLPPSVRLDEALGPLTLSSGGSHPRSYALRMAAGFGSQLVFVLYKKTSDDNCSVI